MRILIVKTGTTVPDVRARRGDFEQWFAAGLGVPAEAVDVVRVYADEGLPEAPTADGIVVTGSASMVTDREPWSERTAAWLARVASGRTPILGVCYGHQLLAHALGGEVYDNPRGRQVGTVDVHPTAAADTDVLWRQHPESPHIPVSHSQSVRRLPDGARLLASTAGDPHHAFAIGDHIWGMQCHPEFDADIVRGYIDARRDAIAGEGLDPQALHVAARDTGSGTLLLRRFAHRVAGG